MEYKFKVGDKVRIIRIDFEVKGNLATKDVGTIYEITKVGEDYYILDDNKFCANFPEDSLSLAKEYKPKKPTHLVVWEEDIDPCKFFESLELANVFIKELSEKRDVKQDSIILVEIKSAKKITIQKVLKPTEYKI